jgi:acyl dehydratase
MSSTRADTGIALLWCMDCRFFAFTAPGATLFPQYIGDVFVAFTSASCRFLKEVHAGDTLYPQLEITKLTTQEDTGIVTTRATVHNQRGELVLDGEHT